MVKNWQLADGTSIALGGAVVGDSLVAEVLRVEFDDARRGLISSGYGPQPHVVALDVDAPHLLDFYLRERYEVVGGPTVKYPPVTPRVAPPEGAVY